METVQPTKSMVTGTILLRAGYFFLYCGLSFITPYISLLYRAHGFDEATIGVLAAMFPMSNLLAVPVWSYAADRYHAASAVMLSGSLVSCACLVAITLTTTETPPIIIILLNAVYAFFSQSVMPLYDRHVLSYLGVERKGEFGMQRVYGAYGWALGALAASQLLGAVGWTAMAIMYSACVAVMCGVVRLTPAEEVAETRNVCEVLKLVFHDAHLVMFLSCVSLVGVGSSIIRSYLFLFLKDIGGSDTLLGVSLVLTVVIEVPLFANSKRMLQKFGVRILLFSAMVAYILRVMGYSLLTNPWYVLVLEPLHGFTFGCMWLASVFHMSEALPAKYANTSQGLLYACSSGVGPMVGSLLGGALYHRYGPRVMFQCAAVIMAVNVVLFALVCVWFPSGRHQQLTDEEEEKEVIPPDVEMETVTLTTEE